MTITAPVASSDTIQHQPQHQPNRNVNSNGNGSANGNGNSGPSSNTQQPVRQVKTTKTVVSVDLETRLNVVRSDLRVFWGGIIFFMVLFLITGYAMGYADAALAMNRPKEVFWLFGKFQNEIAAIFAKIDGGWGYILAGVFVLLMDNVKDSKFWRERRCDLFAFLLMLCTELATHSIAYVVRMYQMNTLIKGSSIPTYVSLDLTANAIAVFFLLAGIWFFFRKVRGMTK